MTEERAAMIRGIYALEIRTEGGATELRRFERYDDALEEARALIVERLSNGAEILDTFRYDEAESCLFFIRTTAVQFAIYYEEEHESNL